MQRLGRILILIASIALLSGATVTAQSDASDDGQREAQVVLPMGRLVFTSDRGGDDLDLWMYEAGNPEPIQLTSGKGRDRTPALSPDGTVVAFSTDRENLDGMQVRGSDLRWYDLYTVAIDGSEPLELVADRSFNSGPDWSPDGSMIAYGGLVIGPDATRMQVHVVPADGSADPVALTDDPVQADGPAWSPDGTRIAFTSLRHGQNADGSRNREIYVMDADGGDPVRLTDDPAADGSPAWSPDGARIVFHSDRAGNDDIYVMAADGTDVIRLTDDPAEDDFPTWSPDGTMIAFVSQRDGDREIYLMEADGSGQLRLSDNPEDFPEHRGVDDFPSWRP
jgi:Tol biopolymer transport system component